MDTAGGFRDEQRTIAEGSSLCCWPPCPVRPVRSMPASDRVGSCLHRPKARYAVVLTDGGIARAQDASKAASSRRLGFRLLSTQ